MIKSTLIQVIVKMIVKEFFCAKKLRLQKESQLKNEENSVIASALNTSHVFHYEQLVTYYYDVVCNFLLN